MSAMFWIWQQPAISSIRAVPGIIMKAIVGQGRENSKQFLLDHPELLAEIDRRVREHYNLDPEGAKIPAPAAEDNTEDKE